jgi:hypothetical protein
MQDLFDFELPHGLQVGAPAACLREDAAALVGKQADGLGPAGINPEDMHHERNQEPGAYSNFVAGMNARQTAAQDA